MKIVHSLHIHYHPKIIGYILKNKQKNICLYSWDYTINHNENKDENEKKKQKKDHIDTIYIDLGLDMNTNIVNIKGDSVWCDVMH